MAKFSLPAIDFTLQSPIKIKRKFPKASKGKHSSLYVKATTPKEETILEDPTFISPVNEIGHKTGTVKGDYDRIRKEILDKQLRTLGHVKRFTVREVIPALVQLFESKRNRRFKRTDLMAMEGYVHGISHATLGHALRHGPFEANKIQIKNGSWRTQRNNASWKIEAAHWNSKENRYECNETNCEKCQAIMDFYNA